MLLRESNLSKQSQLDNLTVLQRKGTKDHRVLQKIENEAAQNKMEIKTNYSFNHAIKENL